MSSLTVSFETSKRLSQRRTEARSYVRSCVDCQLDGVIERERGRVRNAPGGGLERNNNPGVECVPAEDGTADDCAFGQSMSVRYKRHKDATWILKRVL